MKGQCFQIYDQRIKLKRLKLQSLKRPPKKLSLIITTNCFYVTMQNKYCRRVTHKQTLSLLDKDQDVWTQLRYHNNRHDELLSLSVTSILAEKYPKWTQKANWMKNMKDSTTMNTLTICRLNSVFVELKLSSNKCSCLWLRYQNESWWSR